MPLALASSACWGVSDFVGGLSARRVSALAVLAVVEGSGLLAALLWVAIGHIGLPGIVHLLPAAAAGMGGMTALACFYHALSLGRMGIVAPIASLGVGVPVIVGLAGGDRVGVVQVVGIACALTGVLLVSREPGSAGAAAAAAAGPDERRALRLALVAALGFGCFYVGLKASARWSLPWALVSARAPGELLLFGWLLARRQVAAVLGDRRLMAVLMLSGLIDVAANALYGQASRGSALSLVSVAASLYPVTTIALARVFLRERVQGIQGAGVLAALGGVVMMAAG